MANLYSLHDVLQRHSIKLMVGILAAVSVGGIVEIAPLFLIENTIEKVEGMRPYTPARTGGAEHLSARRLLSLPQPADPPLPRRGGTLWSLQPCG